jgi:hypothetical protein
MVFPVVGAQPVTALGPMTGFGFGAAVRPSETVVVVLRAACPVGV